MSFPTNPHDGDSLSSAISSFTTNSSLKIGCVDNNNFGEYIQVDDVKLYDYCLTEQERENNYYLYLDQNKSI